MILKIDIVVKKDCGRQSTKASMDIRTPFFGKRRDGKILGTSLDHETVSNWVGGSGKQPQKVRVVGLGRPETGEKNAGMGERMTRK